ncbi:MAG TPA: metallophosphoesterase [Leptolyngbyaceae cyanobacterium M65_K2018_010]|nr:metallophosphoesterase [Leptolyngbyaceae cyanobacterium M65_K2018_010]
MRPLWIGPLTLETVTVPIRHLPARLEGCRVAQLSDFHYDGLRLPTPLLEAAIALVNQLEVDLVALTGDYVTHDAAPIFGLAAQLSHIRSRYGTVAVLGNHDNIRLGSRHTILGELNRAGIQALWNQVTYPLGEDFPIVGLADFWSRDFAPRSIFQALSSTVPRLVLSHNPDSAAALTPWRVDLQLSGHTHGGQIRLPGVGPLPALTQSLRHSVWSKLPLPSRYRRCAKIVHHWEWAAGLHAVGSNRVYVNRGLGTYAPGRFRCPPEVTLLTLVQA